MNSAKYVIFDMDGVMIDSEYDHAVANIAGLKRLGIEISMEYAYEFVGSTLTHMMETIRAKYQMPQSISEIIQVVEEEKQKIIQRDGYRPIDGIIPLIHTLYQKGLRLAIASSSSISNIQAVADALEISEYFEIMISGSMVKNPKPAPDIFLKAVNLLNTLPQECVVIEDSHFGVQAAKTAGIRCIGFVNPHSGNQDLSKADLQVTHPSECLSYILGIN